MGRYLEFSTKYEKFKEEIAMLDNIIYLYKWLMLSDEELQRMSKTDLKLCKIIHLIL